ncbi:hypothetical protein [Arthrobacter antibioticus]|uniref:hypothetical protein n=1 Tax=Arthrobacter sp. H35-MC1 TaxID=3046203 RepID=UPI0024BA7BB8|nr:hypothetical protein [Arthrobacter sp. H35-MC1]MDJ0316158.1 hypothetical protein [Arthrobacter sp. H35-MC1]
MVDVQVLADSQVGLRHLMLMAALAKRAQGNQVSTDWFYQNAGDTTRDAAQLTGDFETLQEKGWLWFEKSIVGIDEVVLTQPGNDIAEEFGVLRDSPRERVKAARDRVLHWLYDSDLAGISSPVIDRFFESGHANYYGTPFSETELERACNWLHDEELIAGTKTWGGPIPRPNITNKGTRVVESGESVNAQSGNGGTTVHNNNINIKDSHSLNVAAGSSHVSQSNTLTIEQISQTTQFVESARSLVPLLGLPEDGQVLAGQLVDQLEAEVAAPVPSQSKMKELVSKVVDIAVTGTATGLVNALVTLGTGMMTSLG